MRKRDWFFFRDLDVQAAWDLRWYLLAEDDSPVGKFVPGDVLLRPFRGEGRQQLWPSRSRGRKRRASDDELDDGDDGDGDPEQFAVSDDDGRGDSFEDDQPDVGDDGASGSSSSLEVFQIPIVAPCRVAC